MKHLFVQLLMLLFPLLLHAQSDSTSTRIILQLKNYQLPSSAKNHLNFQELPSIVKLINQKFGVTKISKLYTGKTSNHQVYALQLKATANISELIQAYMQSYEIDYAEPDYQGSSGGVQAIKPSDTNYSRQWALNNNGTFTGSAAKSGADIDMENAWGMEQGDSSIVVGIIDSGAKLDHPDLRRRIWRNTKEIPNNAKDDDGNGFVDDVTGWDFANNDNNPTDDFGHGTNVAGILGAESNNSLGYIGIDWHCKLMILKGLDYRDEGLYSWWASAIYYAVDNGAKVINMSLGGTSNSATINNAVKYALDNNVTIVACMMNTNSNTIYYPAVCPGVTAVGATNASDNRAVPFTWSNTSGSNFGMHISVVAPGNFIYGLSHLSNTDYSTYWSGTSQATPMVTGLASLLLAQNPMRTPATIKSIIQASAEDQVGNSREDVQGWDPYYGFGRINAFRALTEITNTEVGSRREETISVYPNPTSREIVIRYPEGTTGIDVRNALGQTVLLLDAMQQSSQWLAFESAGVYHLHFISKNGVMVKKLVVTGE